MASPEALLHPPCFLPPAPRLALRQALLRLPTRSRRRQVCRSASSTSSRIRMCSPAMKESSGNDELHESWGLYSRGERCVVCCGRGKLNCLYCFGDGHVSIGPEAGRDSITCPQCNGRVLSECIRCSGTGLRPVKRFDVLLNKEVRNVTNAELRAPSAPEPSAWDKAENGVEQIVRKEVRNVTNAELEGTSTSESAGWETRKLKMEGKK